MSSAETPKPNHSAQGADARLSSLFTAQGGVRGVFSSKVADYVAARPGYPPALYTALGNVLAEAGVTAPAEAAIADLGAGTGLLTRGLLGEGYGRVFAVEPNDAMRAAADAELSGFPAYRGVAGSAEATTLADASVDLITAAQAFHWFDVEPTRRECRRILRPGGKVALLWNHRVLSDPLQMALDAILTEFGGSVRAAVDARDDPARLRQFFGEARLERRTFPHEHMLDREGWQSLAFSRSYMPARASEAGQRAEAAADRVFGEFAAGGVVRVRYETALTVGGLG